MGSIFGGGKQDPPSGQWFTPPEPELPFNEPLMGMGGSRLNTTMPHGNSPYRTIAYGFGEYDRDTMGGHMPQFDPGYAQQNPWQQQINLPLGAYSYVPPGAHSQFNPQGNFQGSQGMPQMSQINPQLLQQMLMDPNAGLFGPSGGAIPQYGG